METNLAVFEKKNFIYDIFPNIDLENTLELTLNPAKAQENAAKKAAENAVKKAQENAAKNAQDLNVIDFIKKYAFNLTLTSDEIYNKIIEILDKYEYDAEVLKDKLITNSKIPYTNGTNGTKVVKEKLKKEYLNHYTWELNKDNNIEIWFKQSNRPNEGYHGIISNNIEQLLLTIPKKKTGGKYPKSTYKRTPRKHVNSKGVSHVIYTKNNNEYIRKKNKTTGKFNYRKI